MKSFIHFCFAFLIACTLSGAGGFDLIPSAFASETVSPSKIAFSVDEGEEFSFDLSFLTDVAGDFSLHVTPFVYDEKGGKVFTPEVDHFLSFPTPVFSAEAGVQQYVPITVVVPRDLSQLGYYQTISLRRVVEGAARATFQLDVPVFFGVNDAFERKGEIQNVSFVNNDTGDLRDIKMIFENQSLRYFEASFRLEFVNTDGDIVSTMGPYERLVFPEFQRSLALQNVYQKDFSLDDRMSVVRLVVSDDLGVDIDSQIIPFPRDVRFEYLERKDSPVRQARFRKSYKFLYNPIFQGIAILIGLTLVGYSLFNKKD
ncbi:MAG: hypothetical protein P1V18_03350 [Candidatus Gracilibacteria bacterium]|nr:hypothetical protein [Candidatus Gracilibacteria bacterium]